MFRKKRKSSVRQIFSKERFGLFFDGLAAPRARGAMFFVQQNSPFGAGLPKRLSLYTKPSNPFPASKRSAWTKADAKKSGSCFQGWRMSWRCGMSERRWSRPYRASAYHRLGSGHDLRGKIPRFKRGKQRVCGLRGKYPFFTGKRRMRIHESRQWKRRKTTRQFRSAFAFLGGAAQEAFLDACAPSVCPY